LFMLALFLLDVLVVKQGLAMLVVEGDAGLNTAKPFLNVPGSVVRTETRGIEEGFQPVLNVIEQRDCAGCVGGGNDAVLLSCLFHPQRGYTGIEDAPLRAIDVSLSHRKLIISA